MEDLMGYQTNINNATGDIQSNIESGALYNNALVGNIGGGKEYYASQEALGFSNLDYQRNALEAAKLRNWQEEMSNTEIQRRVKDLEQAGFSPMALLSSVSGASTPSGASASSSSTPGSRSGSNGLLDLIKTVGMLFISGAKLGASRELATMSAKLGMEKLASMDKLNQAKADYYRWMIGKRRR